MRLQGVVLVCLCLTLSPSGMTTGSAKENCQFRAKFSSPALRSKATKSVTPIYPQEAQDRKIKGIVEAHVVINEQGKVAEVSIRKSPDALLSEAVENAVKQWEFPPTTIGGRPACLESSLSFEYKLNKGKGVVKDVLAERRG